PCTTAASPISSHTYARTCAVGSCVQTSWAAPDARSESNQCFSRAKDFGSYPSARSRSSSDSSALSARLTSTPSDTSASPRSSTPPSRSVARRSSARSAVSSHGASRCAPPWRRRRWCERGMQLGAGETTERHPDKGGRAAGSQRGRLAFGRGTRRASRADHEGRRLLARVLRKAQLTQLQSFVEEVCQLSEAVGG